MTPELEKRLTSDVNLQLRQQEDYYLGPGDIISIRLIGRSDVLGASEGKEGVEIELGDDETISLPLIGAVSVRDKTVAQLQEDLREAYSAYVKDPRPLVLVSFYNRNQVTVLGTLREPGKLRYDYGDTVMDAIFKAGGISTGGRGGGMAPGRYLRIYRERLSWEERANLSLEELAERLSVEGRIKTREEIVIPIAELVTQGTLLYNIPLQPGDVLYVAPAGTVNVQGRVNSPGVVFLGPSVATLTQAIVERGGMRYSANSIVEVVRQYPDGQYVTYRMNAREMQNRRARDFRVQDGDEIFVYGDTLRAVGEWAAEVTRGSIRAGASATYNPVGGN
ncbi:MAG: polysaccharide biosynthesis/export protein [Candidatus Sumerlaeota bacterium]|nr:polysaccharide biosynthesis/export protein [Candidatus Sumerlaeota bacterium]